MDRKCVHLQHLKETYAAYVKVWGVVLAVILVVLLCVCWGRVTSRGFNKHYTNDILPNKRSVKHINVTEQNHKDHKILSQRYHNNDNIHKQIVQSLKVENIRSNSRHYSKYPHEAGSKRNAKLGREMAKLWKQYGFDKTEIFEYILLLSFPEKPAEIHLMEKSRLLHTLLVANEPAFGASEKKGKPVYPFFAFTVSADITAEVVFCNYGLTEDYDELENLNVDLKNKLFLLKEDISANRNDLLAKAAKYGAVGVIFYPEPTDFTHPGEEYPAGWMLNNFGTIRRSAGYIADFRGDILSNGYPSKEHYHRAKTSGIKGVQHKLPSQPISAFTAAKLFNFMNDNSKKLPKRFRGGLNMTYVLQSGKNRKIRIKISNKLKDKKSLVVCGSLFGSIEPDRYVIIGNHRDAWGYGAADPVSGSAVMTEIVRVLGRYKNVAKYRPRRSIMACSWGAEEFGLLGSTEWADENLKFISEKVIAYLNVDTAIEGNYTIKLKSLDHMAKSMFEATKKVLTPGNPNITLFQDMCHKHAVLKNMTIDLKHPEYRSLGEVSDTLPFSEIHGTGVCDYRYVYNQLEFPELKEKYSLYHTIYDNYDWMNKFIDPTYSYHRTLGQLWLTHALMLSDRAIIPFDLKTYVRQMDKHFDRLHQNYKVLLRRNNVSFEFAKSRIKKLLLQVTYFEQTINKLNHHKLNFIKVRAINDVIMNFARQFMVRSNIGVQTLKQVYATSTKFNGIRFAINKQPGDNWNNVRKEVTALVWCVDMATKSLDLSELQLEEED